MATYNCAIGFSLLFSSPLLELHGTQVHDGGYNAEDVVLLLLAEAQNVKGFLHFFKNEVFLLGVCLGLVVVVGV